MRQYFDDGSYIDYDAAGNPIGGADSTGKTFSSDTSINSSFVTSISSTFVDALRKDLGLAPTTTQLQQQLAQQQLINSANTSATLQKLLPIAVLGALGLFAFKAVKGA